MKLRHVPLIAAFFFLIPGAVASGGEAGIQRFSVEGIPNDVVVFRGSVWVADGRHPRVLEVDPASGQVLRSVHVLGPVQRLAAGSGAIWAAGGNGTFRIDTEQGMAERTEARNTNVVAAGGGRVWTQNGDGTVSKIDSRSGRIELTVGAAEDLGDLQSRVSRDLAVDRGGAWLADGTTGEVVRISNDGDTRRYRIGPPFIRIEEDSVQAGAYASTVAVGAGSVWVCCDIEERVVRLDPATGEVTGTIDVAVGGGDVALTFAEDSLWMSESLGGVYRADPRTLDTVGPVNFDRFPSALAVGERALWLVQGDFEGDLSVVSLRDFPRLVGAEDSFSTAPALLLPAVVLGVIVLVLVMAGLASRKPRPSPA